MKYTSAEQRKLIPDEAIRRYFLELPHIAPLPPEEQEKRWQDHLVRLNKFRDFLSRLDCIGVIPQ